MTKQKQRVLVDALRVHELRSWLHPLVKGSSLPGPLVRFALTKREKISTTDVPSISSKYPDLVLSRIHRIWGPLQTRKLCTGGDVEQGLDRSVERKQSTKVIADQGSAVTIGPGPSRYDPTPDQGVQRNPSQTKLGWPWISVVPCETTGHMGRVQKQRAAGKEKPTPNPKHAGPLSPSAIPFPLIYQDPGVPNVLTLLPMNVTEKISFLLSKYGWSAHTLLELRTLIAQGTKVKPRQVAEVLSKQRQAEIAFNFLHWVLTETNSRLHIKCFTMVMRLLGRVRNYDLLEQLLKDLDAKGYMPDKIIFTAAMGCYAGGQRLPEALQLFVKMKENGFKPDCVTYSVLIQMLSKAKLYQEALKLFEEMLAEGVATDTQLYNCVVSTFGKAGRLDIAYQKLGEMRERGHIPDQFTYGVLLEGYAKANRPQFMDLYREMQTAGIPSNEVIFNIMFHGIERIGTVHDAEVVFSDMERVGLSSNLNAYSTLIGMYSKKGDAAGAQRSFDKMITMGLQPTVAMGNSLLDSYAKTKRLAQASEVLGSFRTWHLDPNLPTLTVCLRCLSHCQAPEEVQIVQNMLSCHGGSQFLSVLMDKSAEKDVAPVIASFFSNLHIEKRQHRREFVDVLINYLYQIGFRSQAFRVLEGALSNFVFPALVEQGREGICSVNLKDMTSGTAIVAITHILPRLAKQFHRKEMTPLWVQIYTAHVADEIPPQDPASVHHAVEVLLQSLRSPFTVGSVQTGGGFVCRGEEVMHWLDEPEIKAMFALRNS